MTVETTPTTKTLKDLGWHLRAADPATDKGTAGWVQENEAAGLKTRVYEAAPDAGLAARRIERLRDDPSADLRTCAECRFTYDANDPHEAEEHADHANAASETAAGERRSDDPWVHEEELNGRLATFLSEQGIQVGNSGITPLGASYLVAGHELVVIGCGRNSQGLRGHVLDAMRLRVEPIRTACVVACCVEDPAEHESDKAVYGVEVMSVEEFEGRHAPALSDRIIQQLDECDTLPDFQKLVKGYALQRAMDYESDERFPGAGLDRVFDAIDAAATRVGLRRREEEAEAGAAPLEEFEEGSAKEPDGATQNISSGDSAESEPTATQNILGEESPPAEGAVGGEQGAAGTHAQGRAPLFPSAESSAGASAGVAALRPQMHPRRIRRHPLLLMRAGGLNEEHVKELQDVLKGGGQFKDPNVVFFDGSTYWNAEGNHRHEAALREDALLDVDVRTGTLEDAIEFAAGSNAEHGLKRNDNDRRLAVVTLLSNPRHFGLSDGLLGKKARVTPQFVGLVRGHLARLTPHIDEAAGGDRDAREIAARIEAPAGLVQVVLDLPQERLDALGDNVKNDTGERLGADGRTYNVKATAEAKVSEPSGPSLFDEPVSEEMDSGRRPFVEPSVTEVDAPEASAPVSDPSLVHYIVTDEHSRFHGHVSPCLERRGDMVKLRFAGDVGERWMKLERLEEVAPEPPVETNEPSEEVAEAALPAGTTTTYADPHIYVGMLEGARDLNQVEQIVSGYQLLRREPPSVYVAPESYGLIEEAVGKARARFEVAATAPSAAAPAEGQQRAQHAQSQEPAAARPVAPDSPTIPAEELTLVIKVKRGKGSARELTLSGKVGEGAPVWLPTFTLGDLEPSPPALRALFSRLAGDTATSAPAAPTVIPPATSKKRSTTTKPKSAARSVAKSSKAVAKKGASKKSASKKSTSKKSAKKGRK